MYMLLDCDSDMDIYKMLIYIYIYTHKYDDDVLRRGFLDPRPLLGPRLPVGSAAALVE